MQLQKLTDGSVRISRMSAWDVQTFRNLPNLADYTADPKSEKRLLPPPAGDLDLSPEMAMDWVEYVVPELRESFAQNLNIVLEDLATLTLDHSSKKKQSSNGSGPASAAEASKGKNKAAEPLKDEGEDEESDPDDDNHETDAFSGGFIPLPGFGSEGEESSSSSGSGAGPESAPENRQYTLTIPPGHAEAWFRALNQARIVLSTRYGIDSEHIPDLAQLLVAGEIEFWFQYELFVNLQGWLVEVVLNPE